MRDDCPVAKQDVLILRRPDRPASTADSAIQSDRPVLILTAGSAFVADGEHLLNDVMTVTTTDGHAVAYQGREARPAVGYRGAYLTVAPGDVKQARVDLPANYAVDGGTYAVSYTQRYLEVGEFNPDGAEEHEVRSNTLSIYANASLIQGKRALRSPI
jgi:hypothetical protein